MRVAYIRYKSWLCEQSHASCINGVLGVLPGGQFVDLSLSLVDLYGAAYNATG